MVKVRVQLLLRSCVAFYVIKAMAILHYAEQKSEDCCFISFLVTDGTINKQYFQKDVSGGNLMLQNREYLSFPTESFLRETIIYPSHP